MKKVLIFFGIITIGLSMQSCLKGNSGFSDVGVCYVTYDDNHTPYGRTRSGTFIIFDEINFDLLPGDLGYFSYSWDEELGYTNISVEGNVINAYNVKLTSTILNVAPTYLIESEAPKQDDLGEDATTLVEVGCLFADQGGVYMGDKWTFYGVYKIKEGQSASMSFYHNPEGVDYNSDEYIYIDVDLTISGTPTSQTENNASKLYALDMSSLRDKLSKSKNIKFRYYVKNGNTVTQYTSTNSLKIVVGEE